MTYRLVGLMSLVLLISLAAFAYLMGSYQVGVMHEVNRTVSAVGKATLQSFEVHLDDSHGNGGAFVALNGAPGKTESYSYVVRRVTPSGETISRKVTGTATPHGADAGAAAERGHGAGDAATSRGTKDAGAGSQGAGAAAIGRVEGEGPALVTAEASEASDGSDPPGTAFLITNGTHTEAHELLQDVEGHRLPPVVEVKPGNGFVKKIIRLDPHGAATASGEAASNEVKEVVMVQIEDVHAESDPTHGTVLKIPTWTVDDRAGQAPGGGGQQMTWVRTAESPFDPVAAGNNATTPAGKPVTAPAGKSPAGRHEIVLPIPTHDFQSLFADYRRRTLYLFLGVFVVGTLLSAGLAARFTRPVRRLDAGIRRLTEGELDVQVEARGRDEIGRLARGFNEMTRRLRAGRERERDLRRREKLSALGRLAAGVAHDVRNPLHSISLTLQNLEETARPAEGDRAQEFDRSVGIIRDEIRRLDRLVENFLRFARSDRTARTAVDLSRLARETAQLVEKEAERRGVRVRVAGGDGAVVVPGHMESIRSSVLNLVLNSFEAMPAGGTLALTVSSGEGEARLEVADTGHGIPEEDQEKVFEFAYTTREEGHGMGLAMVHQVVVEDHGGRVSLQSRPGEGTRVVLAFPRGAAADAETTEISPSAEARSMPSHAMASLVDPGVSPSSPSESPDPQPAVSGSKKSS
jgi:signal transduction histidine kinase